MNGDEPLAVLKEIRDILNDQTVLVKEQYAGYANQIRRNHIIWIIFVIEVFVIGVAWLALK